MEKPDPNLLPATNGRTFEQILQEEYNGNLPALCAACRLETDIRGFSEFLKGYRDAACYRTLLRKIACAFDSTVEGLFPPKLYRQKIFFSCKESPGYRLLAERFHLKSYDRNGKSLLALLKERGFTKSDDHVFRQALVGSIAPTRIPILLQRIYAEFNVSQEELFPSAKYEQCEPSRVPRKHHEVLLDDSAEAQAIMRKAENPPEFAILERQETLQLLLKNVLQLLTTSQRKTIVAHFLDGNGRTLVETAEALGLKDRRNVDTLIRAARNRIMEKSPELLEEYDSLQNFHQNDNRVFF